MLAILKSELIDYYPHLNFQHRHFLHNVNYQFESIFETSVNSKISKRLLLDFIEVASLRMTLLIKLSELETKCNHHLLRASSSAAEAAAVEQHTGSICKPTDNRIDKFTETEQK